MGKRLGAVMDGVQSTTENVTEIRSNGITVNQADSSGLTGHISATQSGIFRNPASINSAVEITVNENAAVTAVNRAREKQPEPIHRGFGVTSGSALP